MYLQHVEERYGEGKFGGGPVLFYLQSSIIYFGLAMMGYAPLWWICEGEDVPIEGGNMTFNQTNTTVVGNCDDFAETAEILYTSSALLMVFMFGVLVPNQITKADELKKAALYELAIRSKIKAEVQAEIDHKKLVKAQNAQREKESGGGKAYTAEWF